MRLPLSSSPSFRHSPRHLQGESEQCTVQSGCVVPTSTRPIGSNSPPMDLLGVWIVLFLFILVFGGWCFCRLRKGRSIFPCSDPPSENALKESEYRNGVRYPLSKMSSLQGRGTKSGTSPIAVKLERTTTMDKDEGEGEQLSLHSPCPSKVTIQGESAEKPLPMPPPVVIVSDVKGVEHPVDSDP